MIFFKQTVQTTRSPEAAMFSIDASIVNRNPQCAMRCEEGKTKHVFIGYMVYSFFSWEKSCAKRLFSYVNEQHHIYSAVGTQQSFSSSFVHMLLIFVFNVYRSIMVYYCKLQPCNCLFIEWLILDYFLKQSIGKFSFMRCKTIHLYDIFLQLCHFRSVTMSHHLTFCIPYVGSLSYLVQILL